MSNYDATARSNRFLVKDVDALKEHLGRYGLTATTFDQPYAGDLIVSAGERGRPANEVTLFSSGGWPPLDEDSTAARLELDDVTEETWIQLGLDDIGLEGLIASHLEENQVAILVEVGQEKLRYLGGTAVAVNAAGETRRVDLDDILELAAQLTIGGHVIAPPHY